METIKINLDTLKRENWSDVDLGKAEIAIDFVQNIMNNHDFDYIREKYGTHRYKQHNRSMLDGPNGVVESISELCQRFPDFAYDVRHIYVDGDYVTLHSHVTLNAGDRGNPDKGFNIYDTWKIVEGQIDEHWDAVQGIDEAMRMAAVQNGGIVKNSNTLF